ncbi:hypothetical protein BDW62DRAFT_208069 [Aspergillus aurantiobrunneus]
MLGLYSSILADTQCCPACDWSLELQEYCSYKSHVKIIHHAGNRATWSQGSALILKDRCSSVPTYEVPSLRLVRENTSIPVPTPRLAGRPVHDHFLFPETTEAFKKKYYASNMHGPLGSDDEVWADMAKVLEAVRRWLWNPFTPPKLWLEYAVIAAIADCQEDKEWKVLLREYMLDCSAASEWWIDDYVLCNCPEDERAKRLLEETDRG